MVYVGLSEQVAHEGFCFGNGVKLTAVNCLALLCPAKPGTSCFHYGRCRTLSILVSWSWTYATVSRIMTQWILVFINYLASGILLNKT